MPTRLHTVVETPDFVRRAKSVFSEEERTALIDFLAQNPQAGDLLQGTGGARKLRWGAKGKGKSGGARVVTFFSGQDIPVFLLTAFAKGEKANMSKAESNALRQILANLVSEYRRRRMV